MATLVMAKEPRLPSKRRISCRKTREPKILSPRTFDTLLGQRKIIHVMSSSLAAKFLSDDTFTALAENLMPPRANTSWIWDSPRVKAILEQPEGSPVDLSGLTAEEINALARDAIGMWADHPYIKDSVEWVRELRKSLYKGIPEK